MIRELIYRYDSALAAQSAASSFRNSGWSAKADGAEVRVRITDADMPSSWPDSPTTLPDLQELVIELEALDRHTDAEAVRRVAASPHRPVWLDFGHLHGDGMFSTPPVSSWGYRGETACALARGMPTCWNRPPYVAVRHKGYKSLMEALRGLAEGLGSK